MHAYGRHVGKHAQVIKDAKDCRWVLTVQIFRKKLEKYLEVEASSSQFQISDHVLQVNLCKKADLVLAKGSQIEEDCKDKLRLGNDIEQDKVLKIYAGPASQTNSPVCNGVIEIPIFRSC